MSSKWSSNKYYYLYCIPLPPAAAQPNKEKPSTCLPICLRPPLPPGRKQIGRQAEGEDHKKPSKQTFVPLGTPSIHNRSILHRIYGSNRGHPRPPRTCEFPLNVKFNQNFLPERTRTNWMRGRLSKVVSTRETPNFCSPIIDY